MIYETRVYRCLPGRLPALLKRFETITLKLWEKHGIKQAGFFTTLVGESNQELTYLLAWESLADREKKWAAFQSDPDWISARAKTEEDGQIVSNIVNQFLVPTSFSSVWPGQRSADGALRRIASGTPMASDSWRTWLLYRSPIGLNADAESPHSVV